MITELDAITDAEQILAQHWTYTVLPAERRAIRATQILEVQLAQHVIVNPDAVTWADIALVVLAGALLMILGS